MTYFLILIVVVMTTAQDKLPFEAANVHRPEAADERDAFAVLPALAVIAEKPQESLLKLAKQVTDARPKSIRTMPLYLLAAGPTLDGPDHVAIHSLTKKGNTIRLGMRYTSARLTGVTLRRNLQWRPVAEVPLQLAPGKWKIVAEWTPYSKLLRGKPLDKPKLDAFEFEVLPASSK